MYVDDFLRPLWMCHPFILILSHTQCNFVVFFCLHNKQDKAKCMIFWQEFWEQLEHLQDSFPPEAGPFWGEQTHTVLPLKTKQKKVQLKC